MDKIVRFVDSHIVSLLVAAFVVGQAIEIWLYLN